MAEQRFVILDRDGTLIVERRYLSAPEQVELIPGVAGALRKFRELGFGLVVVTNQSGIGRGFFGQEQLHRIHSKLHDLLDKEGVVLDGIYFCPHTPEDGCCCRKPRLGMVEMASKDHMFDPEQSLFVGDKVCDIELGKNAGGTTFLVRTGYGAETDLLHMTDPDYVVEDLWGVVEAIRVLPRKI